jgi:hypothetical protein
MTITNSTTMRHYELVALIENTVAAPATTARSAIAGAELAALVSDYSAEAVADYADNHHLSLDEADDWAADFREEYIGGISAREYAEQLVAEGVFGEIADTILRYIDYDAIAFDLTRNDIWEGQSGYLFRSY